MDTVQAYAELGLPPDAGEAEAKTAWRRLVSEWHPDRNVSAAAVARMQRINLAFRSLRQAGFPVGSANVAAAPDAAGTRQRRAGSGAAQRASAPRATRRPLRTISRRIRLTLEEACAGSTRIVEGRLTIACRQCEGIGHRVLGGHCRSCGGSGAVRQRSWFGWIATSSECEACHGAGIARERCGACEGCGSREVDYGLRFRIPAGVRDGDQLFVDGGLQKPEPAAVDLNIRIELIEHPIFRLDADGTVRIEMPVDGFRWLANATVEVPTPVGPLRLPLERERLVYSLPGHGFPVERRGPPGELRVTITPVFPRTASAEQQALLDRLAATTGSDAAVLDERLQRWNDACRAVGAGDFPG